MLHHLGQKEAANKIHQEAKHFVGLPLTKQIEGLVKCVRHHDLMLKSVQVWKKRRVLASWEPLGMENYAQPVVAMMLGADGGAQHAVTIVQDLIFDSNLKRALKLTKELLDWCCNCEGGYIMLKSAVQFMY